MVNAGPCPSGDGDLRLHQALLNIWGEQPHRGCEKYSMGASMMRKAGLIIFTDLDGTLLDDRYSFTAASPALERIKKASIPCIICSSKTRAEIEYYRERLGNIYPFISENGGGIFVPRPYFPFEISGIEAAIHEENLYYVVRLGKRYGELRAGIEGLRRRGFRVRGFGDMTAHDVARLTRLPFDEARMAKQRDFDEPFVFEGSEQERQGLVTAIEEMGFGWTQGQYYHLTGSNDKGKAAMIVIALFRRAYTNEPVTAALGDGFNDVPMLQAADRPIIVRKADGTYDARLEGRGFHKADGIGPGGWNKAVLDLLNALR
jgi:mannosyl-3-phosphoglycerate phosphatase